MASGLEFGMNTESEMAMDLSLKSLCCFAVLRWLNRRYHCVFALCSPSTFWSFWNQQLFGRNAVDLLFEKQRKSLIQHLWSDHVDDVPARSGAVAVQFDLFKDSMFKQMASTLRGRLSVLRSVRPDRHGQLRALSPSFTLQSTADEGGQYRQCLAMVRRELFGAAPSLKMDKATGSGTESESENALFCRVQSGDDDDGDNDDDDGTQRVELWLPSEIAAGDLTESEVFGRWMGLSIRSLIAMDLPFPSWFWRRIWTEKEDAASSGSTHFGVEAVDTICHRIRQWLMASDLNSDLESKHDDDDDGDGESQHLSTAKINEIMNSKPFVTRKGAEGVGTVSKQMVMDWMNIARHSEYRRFDRQIEAIRRGLFAVLPPMMESMARSLSLTDNVTVDTLRSTAVYIEPLNADTKHIAMFWTVLDSFNEQELCRFIAFMSGQEQWPSLSADASWNVDDGKGLVWRHEVDGDEGKKERISSCNLSADILYEVECARFWKKAKLARSLSINKTSCFVDREPPLWLIRPDPITFCDQSEAMKGAPDEFLPEVSTCTLSLRLPHYSNVDVLREKLLKAMDLCTTFDSVPQPFPERVIAQKRSQRMNQATKQRLDKVFADCKLI